MSAWRREALQRLPECREVIESAENPMAVWIELLGECEVACRKQQDDLVRRCFDFAAWCWRSPSADVRTAVACAFYEHLPTSPVLRRDMPRRFDRTAFCKLLGVFCYHLSPDEAAALVLEFEVAQQKRAGIIR